MIYFISGHRNITEHEFKLHYIPLIENALRDPNHSFVIGDCNGVDAMAQQYLINKTKNVTVYHMFDSPRNNCDWPTKGGFKDDIERDTAMTLNSNVDIAWIRTWGKNSGTEQNVLRRGQVKDVDKVIELVCWSYSHGFDAATEILKSAKISEDALRKNMTKKLKPK